MNILVIVGSGMGGTEKAGYLFAESLARKGHQVSVLSEPGHPRARMLLDAGGRILPPVGTVTELGDLLRSLSIDVVHQHVSGYSSHDLAYDTLAGMGPSRPKLIETNVFGHMLDYRSTPYVDFRMFISLTSGMQAFHRVRIEKGPPDPARHGVVFYPLSPEECSSRQTTSGAFRESYGIRPDEFLICRVGRPGHKWTTWECEAFRSAREKNPSLRMILMEPSQDIIDDIKHGKYGDGIVLEKARADASFLADLYSASDLMLHASRFGESFGYTIAEGMVAGLPVITRSTPWGDNAQVELVRHGLDGYVCNSVKGMSRALLELSKDGGRARSMGDSARNRIMAMASIDKETDLLEDILKHVCGGGISESMTRRFESWMDYTARYPGRITKGCYEKTGNMRVVNTLARLYESVRCMAEVRRYGRLRRRRKPVYFPQVRPIRHVLGIE